MFAILGATGHVGQATAVALRDAGAPVRAILRSREKAAIFEALGCEVAVADLQASDALAGALAGIEAVQIIVPLSPQATDPVADLRMSIDSLEATLKKARSAKIVAISDYGAHVSRDIGMPSLFRVFEETLRRLAGHKVILRSAEHMHNWMRSVPPALSTGILPSFQMPVDAAMPTIAAQDLGAISAELLLQPTLDDMLQVIHAEGPRRYSAADVASVVAELSGKPVHARAVPPSQWKAVFESNMPPSLAALMIRTSAAKNEGGLVDVEPGNQDIRRGRTSLKEALGSLGVS